MDWVVHRTEVAYVGQRLAGTVGLETNSALRGDYGGFYTFGICASTRVKLNNKLGASIGGSIATGGGAGAPDGNGLMYRGYGELFYAVSSYNDLVLGYTGLNFPSGQIMSQHFSLGLRHRLPYRFDVAPSHMNKLKLSTVLSFYNFGEEDVVVGGGINFANSKSLYTGVRISQPLNHYLQAELQMGASMIGAVDGFMNYTGGIVLSTNNNARFYPFIRAHVGSGGGGGVKTGGGALGMAAVGLEHKWAALSIGQWAALDGEASVPFVELTIARNLWSNFGWSHLGNQPASGMHAIPFELITGSRVQLASGLDNNNLPYNPMPSIFMGARTPLGKFDFAGETLWAAGGGYGAYAEGIFSAYYHGFSHKSWYWGLNASVLAAGGGGINVGYGIGGVGGVHLGYEITPEIKVEALVRYKHFARGAYNPTVVGVQLIQEFPVWIARG